MCIRQEPPILYGVPVFCSRMDSGVPSKDLSLTLAHHLREGLAYGESFCLGYCSCPLCCKQGPASYNPLTLLLTSLDLVLCTAAVENQIVLQTCFLLSPGQLAAWARTRSARTLQLYVYCCLSVCSICHMPVPKVSWREDPSEMKLFHQHESVPSHFLALLLWTFLKVIYSLLSSTII